MPTADNLKRRVVRARRQVEAFDVRNCYQRELQGTILFILRMLEARHCRPGEEREFARWWSAVVAYRRVLRSPALRRKGARELLEKVLDRNWTVVGR